MSSPRIVFMGTPDLAAQVFQSLLDAPNIEVIGVVTQPDQPKGRGLKLQPSPVKMLATKNELPVLQPARARDATFQEQLRLLEPDLIAVAAYGQILPQPILELPRLGCLNVHTSILPRHRGAAPIQRAILEGDTETGVTIMKMDAGMDTGDILAIERISIGPSETAQSLHDRLAALGAGLLVRTIPAFVSGALQPRPQPVEGVSYAAKIRKQDGLIDWNQSAEAIHNRVRALVPWPGAFTHLSPPTPPLLLKIWEAEPVERAGEPGMVLRADRSGIFIGCGKGVLRILSIQREGGRRMPAGEFLAGTPLTAGTKLA